MSRSLDKTLNYFVIGKTLCDVDLEIKGSVLIVCLIPRLREELSFSDDVDNVNSSRPELGEAVSDLLPTRDLLNVKNSS